MEALKYPSKDIINYHIFNHPIDKVYKILKDMNICRKRITDQGEIHSIKGNNTYDVGSKFCFLWGKNALNETFEVIENLNLEHYKRLKFSVLIEGLTVPHEHVYHLQKDTLDNITIFSWELIFRDKALQDKTLKILDTSYDDIINIIKTWEAFLDKESKIDLKQSESITIKTNIQNVWDAVTNLKTFFSIVDGLGQLMGCQGNDFEIGTQYLVKWTKNEIIGVLRVIKTEIDNIKGEWVFVLEVINKNKKLPKQELFFNFLKIEQNLTFFRFYHIFREVLPHKLICSLSEEKSRILQTMKEKVEAFIC